MKLLIEKEFCNPDEHCNVRGPYYHLYKVDDNGNKSLLKTFERDIKEAAREAERQLDLNELEIAYQKNPKCFNSTIRTDSYAEQILEEFEIIAKNKI